MILKAPEWKTYRTLCELNAFRIYFGESEKLIQAAASEAERNFEAKWTPQNEEEHGELRHEQMEARQMHDEILSPTFRYSAIVTLQAIIEKELLRLVENLEKVHGPQTLRFKNLKQYGKGNLLDRVSKFCEDCFKLRLKDCPQYEALCDLQKIRDCIAHCYGEVDDSRDLKYLINPSLKKRRPGFFALPRTSVKIESTCVVCFTQETWMFFTWVFQRLQWIIDDDWQKPIS
jgi:hypothetical protein